MIDKKTKPKYVKCCKCGESCSKLAVKIIWNEIKGKRDYMCKECFGIKG